MSQGSNAVLKQRLETALKAKDYATAIRLLEQSTLPDKRDRIAKLQARINAAAQSGVTAQLDKAKAFMEAGDWQRARGVLATIDDPAADKLLDRLDKIDPPKAKNAPVIVRDSDVSFTNKFVISLVLLFVLFIPGLIATSIFAGEAKHHRDAPGAGALILLNRLAWGSFFLTLLCGVCMMVMMVTVNNIPIPGYEY